MKHATDMENPITDEFAAGLYHRSPHSLPWHEAAPETREEWRANGRRMLAGDLSVLPWTAPIGTGSSKGFGWGR